MVNITFISQTTSDIRKKPQKLEGGIGMDPSQLVDIALEVYNNREQKKGPSGHYFLGTGLRITPLADKRCPEPV